jgi:hypothetical protein
MVILLLAVAQPADAFQQSLPIMDSLTVPSSRFVPEPGLLPSQITLGSEHRLLTDPGGPPSEETGDGNFNGFAPTKDCMYGLILCAIAYAFYQRRKIKMPKKQSDKQNPCNNK